MGLVALMIMGSKSRLLFITVLVVTVVVAAVILVMPRPLTNHSAVVRLVVL